MLYHPPPSRPCELDARAAVGTVSRIGCCAAEVLELLRRPKVKPGSQLLDRTPRDHWPRGQMPKVVTGKESGYA